MVVVFMDCEKMMEIIIDTKEQLPWLFDKTNHPLFDPFTYRFEHLETGDYSIVGMSLPGASEGPKNNPSITIERKSPSDLFGSVGRGRTNLEKEFERMSRFTFSAIITEIDILSIYTDPPPMSQMRSKSVCHTLLSWAIRYGVHWIPCSNRMVAEKVCYLLLKQFWENNRGIK